MIDEAEITREEEVLRRFLLGELPPGEAREMELRILRDDEWFDLAEAVEWELLEACAAGELAPAERRRVLEHLAATPEGQERLARAGAVRTALTGRAGTQSRAPELEETLGPEAVEALWNRLRDLPPEERRQTAEAEPELANWELCRRVCEESFKSVPNRPARAIEWADLGLQLAESASPGLSWGDHLQAYAYVFLGNARRAAGDLAGAEAAFARSRVLRANGSARDCPLEQSRFFELEASLHRVQGNVQQALSLLDRALTVARGEEAGARIVLQKAKALEEIDEYEKSVEILYNALPVVGSLGNERLRFVVLLNLSNNLVLAGRTGEAAALLPAARALGEKLGNEVDILRVRWTEGLLAHRFGRLEQAKATFDDLRREFMARDNSYDAALATLELASILLEQGRHDEVKSLAREAGPAFRALGLSRETLASFRVFQKAAEQEAVTAKMARHLLSQLKKTSGR